MPVKARAGGQGRVRGGRPGAQQGSGSTPSPPTADPSLASSIGSNISAGVGDWTVGGGGSPTFQIIAEGDSLTSGQGATPDPAHGSYPVQLVGLLGSTYTETNLGLSGRYISDISAAASTEIYPLYSNSYIRQHLLTWIGTNDLAIHGDSAATVYANYVALLRAMAAQAQSVGVKVYIYAFTVLPRNTSGQAVGFEAARQTFNTSVRSNYHDFADALIDVGNDATIGGATAYSNATYYSGSDFTHLTTDGYAIVASLAQSAINGLVASIPAPVNKVAPAITGTATVGNVLTASLGNWVGAPTSFTYQWKRGGTNISSATASTYTLVSADLGNTITVIVTGTGEAGSASATSAATATVTDPYAGNLFTAPRDASGDGTASNKSGCTLTLDSVAGPDSAVLADTIALDAGGYIYKRITSSTNGAAYQGKISLRADSSMTVRGRLVVSNFADATATDFSVTTTWQTFDLPESSGHTNSGTGEIQFGLDTRGAAGADGLAKTFYADFWFLGVV
jgi:lysophospholipase L1-like esterase